MTEVFNFPGKTRESCEKGAEGEEEKEQDKETQEERVCVQEDLHKERRNAGQGH